MTVQLEELVEGTKVSVTWNKEGESISKEGSVVAVNETMLLIKPKGAMLGELIQREDITEISELTEVTKLTVRKLRIVKMGEARQHLADRHGYLVNDAALENERIAFETHEAIDHSDLSHVHEDKDESPRVEAIEAAAADGDDTAVEGDEG